MSLVCSLNILIHTFLSNGTTNLKRKTEMLSNFRTLTEILYNYLTYNHAKAVHTCVQYFSFVDQRDLFHLKTVTDEGLPTLNNTLVSNAKSDMTALDQVYLFHYQQKT